MPDVAPRSGSPRIARSPHRLPHPGPAISAGLSARPSSMPTDSPDVTTRWSVCSFAFPGPNRYRMSARPDDPLVILPIIGRAANAVAMALAQSSTTSIARCTSPSATPMWSGTA